MITVTNNPYVFPNPIEIGSTNTVIWNFEGDPSEIVHIKAGCGCTAECKVVGNTIQCEYTDQEGAKISAKQIPTHYPKGLLSFKKKVTVFLKDDEELYTIDGANKKYNDSKAKIVLNLSGEVRLR